MEKSNLRIKNNEEGTTVFIDKDNVQESVQYIQIHQIKRVEVTYDYEESQIDFLSECPTVEFLSLEGSSVKDISGIYCKCQLDYVHFRLLNDAQLHSFSEAK